MKVSDQQWRLGQNGGLDLVQRGLSGGIYGGQRGMEQVFSEKQNRVACENCL